MAAHADGDERTSPHGDHLVVNQFTWKEWLSAKAGADAVAAQAAAFRHAGDLCFEHATEGGAVPSVLPAVVNWCFSIELYLKALIFNDGRHPGRTHRLDQLLALLSPGDAAAVEQRWRPLVARLELADLLGEVGNYFAEVRYDYETADRAYQEAAIRRALTAIALVAESTSWAEGPLPKP